MPANAPIYFLKYCIFSINPLTPLTLVFQCVYVYVYVYVYPIDWEIVGMSHYRKCCFRPWIVFIHVMFHRFTWGLIPQNWAKCEVGVSVQNLRTDIFAIKRLAVHRDINHSLVIWPTYSSGLVLNHQSLGATGICY